MTLAEYIKQVPRHERNALRQHIVAVLGVSEVYVRSMCHGHKKILGICAIPIEKWAESFSKGNDYGLGFPSCSIEYRMMKEGHVIRTTASKYLPCNKEAEEIESLVSEMSKQNEMIAYALHCHYFQTGTLRSKAKKFKYLMDILNILLILQSIGYLQD